MAFLTYSEILFIMVGAVVMLGPQDLPIIARAAGRLTGRAIGYLQVIRSQADSVLQQSQAGHVQKELRDAMAQLDAIRHEVRAGMSIMHQGPYVREGYESHGSGLQQATRLVHKVEHTLDRFVESTGKEAHHAHAQSASKTSVELQRQATSYARFAGHLGGVEKPESARGIGGTVADTSIPQHQISVLPISAVSMGLFPERTGPLSGGSDLMLESLAERKVAHQALEFLAQPNEQPRTDTSISCQEEKKEQGISKENPVDQKSQ